MTEDYFAREVQHAASPAEYLKSLDWTLYLWQAFALGPVPGPRLILSTRQGGKTFCAAAKARHRQRFDAIPLIPIVCPDQAKSETLIKRVKEIAIRDPAFTRWDRDNLEQVEENGSAILGLPGTIKGVVSHTAPLLVIDEAGLVGRELYETATPMQAAVDRPELWVMSSAWYKEGWYWEAWDRGPSWDGTTGWVKILVRPPYEIKDHRIVDLPISEESFRDQWSERGVNAFFSVPKPAPEFLEAELSRHPEAQVRQQFLCEFLDVADRALSPESVAAIFRDGPGRRIFGPSNESGVAFSDLPGRRIP